MSDGHRIVVVGAGAFGTALAAVIALEGRSEVTLLGRDPSLMADLRADGMHNAALPRIHLPDALQYSAEPEILAGAETVLFAMPSQAQADAAAQFGPYLAPGATVVTCAKVSIAALHGCSPKSSKRCCRIIRLRFSRGPASLPILPGGCRRRWPSPRQILPLQSGWPTPFPGEPFGYTHLPTERAFSSAGRSRTCSPSLAASSKAWDWVIPLARH